MNDVVAMETEPIEATLAPSVNQPEDVMEIPETDFDPTKAPKELITEDVAVLEPEEEDILEEISQLESFQEYERDLARETRGWTSDYL